VTLAELRRRLISAQGYATRFRRGGADDVVETIRRLACVQLDSISTVDRAHRITLSTRVGAYPPQTETTLLQSGRIFEFWAHEACLLPIEDFRFHRWRMERMRESGLWGRGTIDERPELAREILDAIRERGPLGSRHFDGGAGRGGMWNWKPAKEMLETLFAAGELVTGGRDGFQRLYDLPERVIPREHLDAPGATEDEYVRWAIVRGVGARGALTAKAITEMWRLRGGIARLRPHLDAVLQDGLIEERPVDDGGAPVYVLPGSEAGDASGAVLLAPFDNLLWDRDYLERVFGFRHVIEVYKRPPERIYGYYVLPLLWRDRFVGRADLKSDRAEGLLRLQAFHREPGVRASAALETALQKALDRLARSLGLSSAAAGRSAASRT
jgi:uncharacterized protein